MLERRGAIPGAGLAPAAIRRPSSPAPSQAPQPTPGTTVGAIDHPVGATDVVLRLEEGGGFVPMEMMAAQAPTFTLYGNGVIVFQPKVETFPEPDANGVIHSIPWRTAKLDESQIQDLLEFAIGTGGLGTAKDSYVEGGIADAPEHDLHSKAGGLDKTVVVNALADGGDPGSRRGGPIGVLQARPEAPRLRSGRLDPDRRLSARRLPRRADGSRAAGRPAAISWPWPAIQPTDVQGRQTLPTAGRAFRTRR